ncbi:MAG: radical SAM protein [Nanoarchaeota archaeon]|nr:radical SAM protein [Nanoarchaeota archaeon]
MEIINKLKDGTKQQITKQIIKNLHKISDENLIRLTYLAEKIINKNYKSTVQFIRKAWQQKHPTTILAKNLSQNLSKNCKEKLVKNLFINSLLTGPEKRKAFVEKESFYPPSFMLISPTMRCNLNCIGCSTREYTIKDDLPFETIDRVIKEAKEMGIYFIVTLGGETFVRQDMFDIYKKHNDVYFQVYTNGTLISKKVAKELSILGNVAPILSLEGFEKETDARRGKNVYKKVMQAMDNLREAGVLYGFSVTVTKNNAALVVSDNFINKMLDKGCSIGWYFQYIPIGKCPDIKLMATPAQRDKVRRRIGEIRNAKPVFIGDFWGDGPGVGGCIAAARPGGYFHINHKGDVEPCGFVHFATDNIKNKSLKEALNSDFFKALRERQQFIKAPKRYSDNLLTPCMIIDQPWVLREVCQKCKAYPTHPGAETIISKPEIIKHLDEYSEEMHKITDPIRENELNKKFKHRKS